MQEADSEWILGVVITLELIMQLCLKYSYSVALIVELWLSISVVSDLKKKDDIPSLFQSV